MRPPFVNVTGGPWPKGTTPTSPMLRQLDQRSSELVNAEDGGTWSPASPIVIGHKPRDGDNNIRLVVGSGSVFSGYVETIKGNSRQPIDADGLTGIIVTGADAAAPVFETSRSRVIRVSFLTWTESSEVDGNSDTRVAEPLFVLDTDLMSPRAVMGSTGKRSLNVGCVPVPQRLNHFSSRIASVKFFFRIGSRPDAMPTDKVRFRVVRVKADTSSFKMHTAAGAYDANGWLIDPVSTVDDYYSDGNVRMLDFVPDEFNTATDPGDHSYAIQWMDDSAPIPDGQRGNAFLGAQVTIDQIAGLRSE